MLETWEIGLGCEGEGVGKDGIDMIHCYRPPGGGNVHLLISSTDSKSHMVC